MNIVDMVIVNFWVESGCDPKEEVSVCFRPVNCELSFDCTLDELKEATDQYIADNELRVEVQHEVLFSLVTERDIGGAIIARYWDTMQTRTN